MKKILTIGLIVISANAHAVCSTIAKTWSAGVRMGITEKVYSHHEYNITNQTSIPQHYDICFHLSTQFYDHSHMIANRFCESVDLQPGQSTGSVRRDPTVDVNYPRSSYRYHASIDAITTISGECYSTSHMIKDLLVYES